MSTATFMETATCPEGHAFKIRRRAKSAGHLAYTVCKVCGVGYNAAVSGIPLRTLTEAMYGKPTRESHVEDRLVKRVKEEGGEVRKVKWIGRLGAPDRLVMLPERRNYVTAEMCRAFAAEHGTSLMHAKSTLQGPVRRAATIWVELKAPGKARTFPSNAHERAQHREHERMRKMGQRVEVIDSYEQIEELLK